MYKQIFEKYELSTTLKAQY